MLHDCVLLTFSLYSLYPAASWKETVTTLTMLCWLIEKQLIQGLLTKVWVGFRKTHKGWDGKSWVSAAWRRPPDKKYVYTTAGGGIAATPSPQSPPLFTLLAFFTLKDKLYAHIWSLQLYWQVLFLPWSSSPEELCPPMQVLQVDSELFYQRMMGICVPGMWSGWACPVGSEWACPIGLKMLCSFGSSKYRQ